MLPQEEEEYQIVSAIVTSLKREYKTTLSHCIVMLEVGLLQRPLQLDTIHHNDSA
jgi:hypothetical protein